LASPECELPDHWCELKRGVDLAKTVTGYFSTANTAVEIGKIVLGALGLIQKDPGISDVLDTIRLGFDDTAWRQIEIGLGNSLGAAETVISNIRRRGATSQDDDDSNDAVRALINSAAESALFSFPLNQRQSEGMERLGYSKDNLDRQGPNSFYDWRLGISVLVRVISYRLVVLAAFHPDFWNDTYGWADLDDYREALQRHYDKMLKGVRCGTREQYYIKAWSAFYECADIHTGLSIVTRRDYGPPFGAPRADYGCHSDTKWDLFWGGKSTALEPICATSPQTAEEVLADLKREIIRSMPLYEVKAMIDALYLLTHPMRDLTAQHQRIPSYVTPTLCLEAKSEASGAALQLWTCDNDPLQYWVYDRPSGHICNTYIQKCLEITYRAPAFGQNSLVSISDYFEDEWQRWTYNPETNVLLSAMGTVLTIQSRNPTDYVIWLVTGKWPDLKDGDRVWSGPGEDTVLPRQQWLADQAPPVVCKSPSSKQNTRLFGNELPNC
jgi:Ricin-type beta-trefoil lectin domain